MRKWSVRLALVGYVEFIWAKGRMRLDVRLLSCLILAIDYLKPITYANRLVEIKMGKIKIRG